MKEIVNRINSLVSKREAVVFMIVIIAIFITTMAWQSDDAYHGYVMAKNLVEGHGFVYNIGERVNASTCPLFTLVIALGYLLCRHMFLVSIFICILFSTFAIIIAFKDFCKSSCQVFCVAFTMIISSSFIAYTTSGLENCMLFLLSALFLKVYFGNKMYGARSLFILSLLISLIAMTRMDSVLIFIPMILYVYLTKRDNVSFHNAVLIGIAGLLPFVLWELFSLFYFGFPFPNTFYAKLASGIPHNEYLVRGWMYYYTTLLYDPAVVLIPTICVFMIIVSRKKHYILCAFGVLAYIGYIFCIGGDFMVGRHFTVIFFISVIALIWGFNNSAFIDRTSKLPIVIWSCILFMGILALTVSRPLAQSIMFPNGPISDERDWYFPHTSLVCNIYSYCSSKTLLLSNSVPEVEYRVNELDEIGIDSALTAFAPGIVVYNHPNMYLVDKYGLFDPLLSKLPAVREDDWRVGHLYRDIPNGYSESIALDSNLIDNESLCEYYNVIRLITRGPLFSRERISAIVDINLGRYDYLIEDYCNTLDDTNQQMIEKMD